MAALTERYGGQGARGRMGAASAAVGLHALFLVLALTRTTGLEEPPKQAIATFDVTEPGPPAPDPDSVPQPREVEPTPPQPEVVPPPVIERPEVSTTVIGLLEYADMQAAGRCDLTYPVQVALQISQQVQREIPSIPQSRRSVANAIALWSQTWVEPDQQLSKAAVDAIMITIATTIEASSEACRSQIQGGPRLIYLSIAGETTVLALGSGDWTWQQVLDSAQSKFAMDELSDSRVSVVTEAEKRSLLFSGP